MTVLLIDNYDSFVHNLARYVRELGATTLVKRNDEIHLDDIHALNPSHIILSPGPKTPLEAGITVSVIRHFGATIPILGVCLGHQAIGFAYGGKVIPANQPMHGKASLITHTATKIFAQLDNPLKVGRYHSLIVADHDLPDELRVTARCEKGEIMALEHRQHFVFGVQFHPESILTQGGHLLLKNFLDMVKPPAVPANITRWGVHHLPEFG